MKKKQILAILMTLTMALSPQAIFAAAEEPVIDAFSDGDEMAEEAPAMTGTGTAEDDALILTDDDDAFFAEEAEDEAAFAEEEPEELVGDGDSEIAEDVEEAVEWPAEEAFANDFGADDVVGDGTQKMITITFVGNGIDLTDQNENMGPTFQESHPAGTCLDEYFLVHQFRRNEAVIPGTSKVFAGWSPTASASDLLSEYYGDYTPDDDMTLTAMWGDGIVLTYHAGDAGGFEGFGEGQDASRYYQYVLPGTVANSDWGLANPTLFDEPAGKMLCGWTLQQGSSDVLDGAVFNSNTDLYPVFTAPLEVAFNANGGKFKEWGYDPVSGEETEIYYDELKVVKAEGQKIGQQYPVPEWKDGLPFCGYSVGSVDGKFLWEGDVISDFVPSGPVTLYAHYGWAELIWCHANPGKFGDGSYVYAFRTMRGNTLQDMSDVQPIPADDKSVFDHWSAEKDKDVPIDLNTYTVTDSTDIYAVYKQKEEEKKDDPVTPAPAQNPTQNPSQDTGAKPAPVIAQPTAAKKAAQPMTVKTKTVTLKASKTAKKKQTVKAKKAFTVKKAQGKVTYKKKSGSKNLSISSAGKITVKKGTKKGTYRMKVIVTAAGNAKYAKGSKTVTVKVKVKE